MGLLKQLLLIRQVLVQGPSFLYYFLLSWLYPTVLLRMKAVGCSFPTVRKLLLRRSGVEIGRNVTINMGTLVQGSRRVPSPVTIGDRVALGPNITFITSSAPNDSRLRSHPEVQSMIKGFGPIKVGEDAWIGAHVVIFPGVRIGRGAIVGAGSVVNRDVEPYTVVAGVPARKLRQISSLEELQGR